MIFDKLKEELLQSLRRCFPAAKVDIKERRSVILELRAYIDKATFIEVYANSITGKKSFALISEKIGTETILIYIYRDRKI